MKSKKIKFIYLFVIALLIAVPVLMTGGCFNNLASKTPTEKSISKKTNNRRSADKKRTPEKWSKNPSILMDNITSTCTLRLDNNTYRMYFMAEGKIYYADSTDAKTFGEKTPTGIIQSEGKMLSNPSVLRISNNDWIMIYEEQPMKKPGELGPGKHNSPEFQRNLYLATSKDGKSFQSEGLAIDSSKDDDYFASVPEPVKLTDGRIRLYYVSGGEATGSAISTDKGKTWKREPGYRLEDLAVDPEILFENNQWTMYYAELPSPGNANAIYKATSKDGLIWTKNNMPLIKPDTEEGFVVDPDIIKVGDSYRMFFGESGGGLGAEAQRINLFYADKVK